ncbi:MAG: NADH-quinone oxidoreductase subunit N [Betaproteobacteria bacterium]
MYARYLASELVLGGAGLLLLLLKVAGRPLRVSGATALTAFSLLVAEWSLWPLRGENLSLLGGTVLLDPLAFYFKTLLLGTALLTVIGAAGWTRRHPETVPDFHALLLLETAALMLMVSAGELLSLYLALEASVSIFFALAVLQPGRPTALEATLKYVLVAGVSAAFLLYGMSFLYGFTGTTNLEEIGVRFGSLPWTPLLLLAGLLVLTGFGFKLAVVPFHFWSPDVYQAAPTPVTAYLAVASKAAGLGVTVRFFATALSALTPAWSSAFAGVAAATVVFGNLAAIPQTDLKRLLAYSSIAQSGYLFLGLAALSAPGFSAALFYAALYTASNLAAFFVVIAWEEAAGQTDLAAFAGLARRAPFLAAALLVALLSLGGLPPLAGFIGKLTLFLAVVHAGQFWLAFIAVTMSVVSVYYYLNVVRVMYVEPEPASAATPARVAPTTLLAIALTVLGTLLLGVYPAWLLRAADWATRLFWG